MFFKFFLVSLLIASSCCDDNLQDLTKNIQGQLATDAFNAGKEQALEYLHQKCLENADEDAYLKVKESREQVLTCIQGLINVEEVKKEVEAAKPTGDIDVVFKKYCDKTPQFKSCVDNYAGNLERCLSENERVTMNIVRNITESLAGFVCFKDGDRIALFIAEQGPECFRENQEKIKQCANSTLSAGTEMDLKKLAKFSFDKENCDKIAAFQHCAVTELETCREPTPANMLDSLFNFILKATPCKNFKA